MSLDTYGLYAIAIGGAPDTIIHPITSQRIPTGIQELLIKGSGEVDAIHASVISQDPRIRFTTPNLKAILDEAGVGGLVIDESASTNAVVLYFRKRAMDGFYETGSEHIAATINKGLLLPVTARANQDAEASIDYELITIWDGTNSPIVLAKDQAASVTLPAIGVWTLGPAYINGTEVDHVQSTEITFGLNAAPTRGGGLPWAKHCAINSRDPRIDINTLDLAWLDESAGLGLSGKARSSATSAYFRKKNDAGVEADASAVHIKFDMGAGRMSVQETGGDAQGDATAQIQMTPIGSGGNAPIVVTTASAIS